MRKREPGREQPPPGWRRLSAHTENLRHEGKGSASQSPGKEYEQAAGVYHNANAEIRWKAAPGEGFRLSTVTLCDISEFARSGQMVPSELSGFSAADDDVPSLSVCCCEEINKPPNSLSHGQS